MINKNITKYLLLSLGIISWWICCFYYNQNNIVQEVKISHKLLPKISAATPKEETAFECLRKNIWFEANTDGEKGMVAVANVTMTRVKHPNYPNDVCSVVHQGEYDNQGNPVKNKCQFSWYCDGKSDRIMVTNYNKERWKLAGDIAKKALNNKLEIIVADATHYHANYVNPNWTTSLQQVTSIGQHVFYKQENK